MPGDPFYGSHEWKDLRRRVLIRDRYCCAKCGRSVRAKGASRVDHIIERRERPDLSLCESNLRTLCVDCDALRHRAKGGGDGIVGCDARGVPLSPSHHWHPASRGSVQTAPRTAHGRPGAGIGGGLGRGARPRNLGSASPPDGGHAFASQQVIDGGASG
jgi:hypothetical protein